MADAIDLLGQGNVQVAMNGGDGPVAAVPVGGVAGAAPQAELRIPQATDGTRVQGPMCDQDGSHPMKHPGFLDSLGPMPRAAIVNRIWVRLRVLSSRA